jgi:hypothetical protein
VFTLNLYKNRKNIINKHKSDRLYPKASDTGGAVSNRCNIELLDVVDR